MLRLAFRSVGFILLALGFAALIVDGTRSIAAGTLAIVPLGRSADMLFPGAIAKLKGLVLAHAPGLWDPVVVRVLEAPVWLVVGLLGAVLILLTRRPRPKIGYARR